jgi:short-subunit dehydrogenase
MDLTRKTALITGASSGIGEQIARQFARRGVRVAIISERKADLERVAESICESGGTAYPFHIDLSQAEQVEGLIARVEREIGPLDIVVNNAGIGLGATILETRPKDLRLVFEINYFAVETLCREALAAMSARRSGCIVNVTSAAARMGQPGVSAYSATKGAVHTYTQALRLEAGQCGVGVMEVLPISVRTAFFDNAKGQHYRPSGVVITADSVAQSIVSAVARKRLPAELLPFRWIRLAFIAESIAPEFMAKVLARTYARSLNPNSVSSRVVAQK